MSRKYWTALAMLLILLALAACQDEEPTPTPVPPTATAAPATPTPIPPTPTPQPTATPTPLSAEAILQAAFDAAQQAISYRFDMDAEVTISGPVLDEPVTMPMIFTGAVVMPDTVQGTMKMTVNSMEVELQVISIEGVNYVTNPLTNRWQISPDSGAMFDPEDLVMDPSDVQELALVGPETVDGVPTYHLTGRAVLPFTFEEPLGQVQADMQVEYWISQQDQRIVRSVVEGSFDFSGEAQLQATLAMTVHLFDYDEPIEVVAPELAAGTILDLPDAGRIVIGPRTLAQLASDTSEDHVQRGLASLADGRLWLAVAHFHRALELRPDWPEALLYRGAALAIDGDVDLAFADLDQAIAAEPERADAYALRAWTWMRAYLREQIESEAALEGARTDIAQALALQPNLAAAQSLQGLTDVLAALNLYDSEPEQAVENFESAMAALNDVMLQAPDDAAGNYLPFASTLFQLNSSERGWLFRQADEATAQIETDPASYSAYATRGLARLFLGSQGMPNMQTLQESGDDLLAAIALIHSHLPALADPAGGPLQVARIWDLQEAAYSSGSLYNEVFFGQDPASFPEFGQMLASYWELHDLFTSAVDDPIVFSVAFSPDGSQIATLSESGPSFLRIWDAASGEKLLGVKLTLDGFVVATTNGNLAFSPDGSQVAVAYTNPVARVIDVQTGEVTQTLTHTRAVNSVAFSPDGLRLLTVDPEANAPVLWDVGSGTKLLTLTVESPVYTAAFSPDGRLIAANGETAHLWDAETGDLLLTLPGYDSVFYAAAAISPNNRTLAVPGYPVRVYDLLDETELYTLTLGARTVAFSPDGARLATAGYEAAGVWTAESGELIFLAGHPAGVDAVAWSPDGRLLVTGGPDGRIRIWDAETGAELWSALAVVLWWEPEAVEEKAVATVQTARPVARHRSLRQKGDGHDDTQQVDCRCAAPGLGSASGSLPGNADARANACPASPYGNAHAVAPYSHANTDSYAGPAVGAGHPGGRSRGHGRAELLSFRRCDAHGYLRARYRPRSDPHGGDVYRGRAVA